MQWGKLKGDASACAQVLGSKAVMLACLTLGLQLPFDIHLPVRSFAPCLPSTPTSCDSLRAAWHERARVPPGCTRSHPSAVTLGRPTPHPAGDPWPPQVHAVCLALLVATNPAACATPYATAGAGRAHMGQLADALARGLKYLWMPLSPERLRFGCGPLPAHRADTLVAPLLCENGTRCEWDATRMGRDCAMRVGPPQDPWTKAPRRLLGACRQSRPCGLALLQLEACGLAHLAGLIAGSARARLQRRS